MSADKQIEKALFDAALSLNDSTARAEFLDQACIGQPALRRRLETLLKVQSSADAFFRINPATIVAPSEERPQTRAEIRPGDTTLANQETDVSAVVIGRYRLVRRLGEGGCGVVYLAEQQEPVRRRVALKIIRLGMDTERVIARFEAERQALAMMDHPNIAHVLDAGATDSGRPYFVMEIVPGTKVTDYCNQHRLNLTERLELFIQICHAIQHAHQKGIIHRDIKPSNILITDQDGNRVPKVIDFGIAKATQGRLTDNMVYTAADQFIGTPAYMSPEQAETSGLDVDTRSDIYSLGVLLYELVTGRTPFDSSELLKSGVDAMRKTLRDRDPRPPSTLLTTLGNTELRAVAAQHHADPPRLISLVKGDLDWIVMKALEKDRRRRYETANGLAMDVQRFLNNEPILARPPSRIYRLGKLVRRNKLTFAAISAVTFTLLAGLATSTWLLLREREARQRAVAAEQKQSELRREADALRQQAENRQKLSEAMVLVSRDAYEQADRLIAGIPALEPKLEYAELYRRLGEWHVAQGRWHLAMQRFAILLQVSQPDDWDITTLDYLRYGPLLLETGNALEYDRFRRSAVAHFTQTTNPVPAERVLKMSLLTPASPEFLQTLRPLAQTAIDSLAVPPKSLTSWHRSLSAWRCFSLALMEYRRGNLGGVSQWRETAVSFEKANPARDFNFDIVSAMADYQLGRTNEARSRLAGVRAEVEKNAREHPITGSNGYWFDWIFADILLREATALMWLPGD